MALILNNGDTFTYTITACNAGPSNATGVYATVTLANGLSFLSYTATQGTYVSSTGVWTVGDVSASTTSCPVLKLVVQVTDETLIPFISSAVIAGDQFDPVTIDNLDSDGTGCNCTDVNECVELYFDWSTVCSQLSWTVNAGVTENTADNANGEATMNVCADQILHFWSSDSSINIGVTDGSAIVDLTTPGSQSVVTPTLILGQWTHDDGIGTTVDIFSTGAEADNVLTIGANGGSYFSSALIYSGISAIDTNCIDMTFTDNGDGTATISANPIIDPAAGNQLVCNATGLYVPAGGATLQVLDTNCIDMTLSGSGSVADPYVFSATPIISGLANNLLTCEVDGLYVTAGTVDSFFSGDLGGTSTFTPGDTVSFSRTTASTVSGFTAADGGVADTVTYAEYLTSLTWIDAANRLVYIDENAGSTNIDFPGEKFLGNAEYFAATNIILLTMDDGITTHTLDLSDLEDNLAEAGSTVTAANHGFIWTGGDGTVINWRESLSTLVDNGDNTYTYTDENGTATIISDTITTLTETNKPAATSTHSFTYTNEDGVAITIEEALTSLAINGDGYSVDYTDENGTVVTITPAISAITNLIAGNQIATHTAADGTVSNILETITTLVDNGDSTYTYTSEDGTATIISSDVSTLTATLLSGQWDHLAGGITTSIFSTAAEVDNILTIGANGGSYLDPENLGLISADAGNVLVQGTDNLLYVPAGAVTVVSADANNLLTAGTDGGAWVDSTTITQAIDWCIVAADMTAAEADCFADIIVNTAASSDAGNALAIGTDGGLYVPDEVIENAGTLTGAAPLGAQWGIDTTTGQAYYVSGGNWTAVPGGGGGGTLVNTSDTATTGNHIQDFNSTSQQWNNLDTIRISDNTSVTIINNDATSPYFQSKMESSTGSQGWVYADPNEAYVSHDGGNINSVDSYARTNGTGASLEANQSGLGQGKVIVTPSYTEISNSSSTPPAGTPSNAVWLYEVNGELFVRDSSGNTTLLSPHSSVIMSELEELFNPLDQLRHVMSHFNGDVMQTEYRFLDTVWVAIGNFSTGLYKVYNEAREVIKEGFSEALKQ